jgi:hypothetical protein
MRSILVVVLLASVAFAESEPIKVGGSLDRATIDRVIMKRKRYIRACYEKELTVKPTLEGKVTVKFRIEPNGKTSNVSARGLDANIEGCIAAQFRKLVFPKSVSPADLTYPLAFIRG